MCKIIEPAENVAFVLCKWTYWAYKLLYVQVPFTTMNLFRWCWDRRSQFWDCMIIYAGIFVVYWLKYTHVSLLLCMVFYVSFALLKSWWSCFLLAFNFIFFWQEILLISFENPLWCAFHFYFYYYYIFGVDVLLLAFLLRSTVVFIQSLQLVDLKTLTSSSNFSFKDPHVWRNGQRKRKAKGNCTEAQFGYANCSDFMHILSL